MVAVARKILTSQLAFNRQINMLVFNVSYVLFYSTSPSNVFPSFYAPGTCTHITIHVTSHVTIHVTIRFTIQISLHYFSHLNGAVLETLSRPSLLITDAFTALNIQARRKERDIQLMSESLMKFYFFLKFNLVLHSFL